MYSLITEKALFSIASSISPTFDPPYSQSSDILSYKVDNVNVIYSKNETCDSPYYILIKQDNLKSIPIDASRYAFMRLARTLRSSAHVPVRLPNSWSEYHAGSLISFFAIPRDMGSYRWVAEIRKEERALFFHDITSTKKIILEEFQIPSIPILSRNIINAVIIDHKAIDVAEDNICITPQIDLQTLGSAAISGEKTYERWEKYLTPDQKDVVRNYFCKSVKLVGSAGSGKTLTLCLKAIHDSRQLMQESQEKILFITHSWAMAERIDETLTTLNGGIPHNIDVLPLLEIMRDILNRQNIAIDILGIDSADGRQQQLNLIESLVSDFVKDKNNIAKITKFYTLSDILKQALHAEKNSSLYQELIENIYLEINGSLSAEGILPTNTTKIDAYIKGEGRPDFLPPFDYQGDRIFIIEIYNRFISTLCELNYMTTDQLVSDAITIMETFSWSVKRRTDGTKYIFIDELQYFNAQERYAITLLGSDTSDTFFTTAEDPRQGIFSFIYKNWNENRLVKGELKEIELKESHRFSRGIIEFIKFLYSKFPLNSISLNYHRIEKSEKDKKPTLYIMGNKNDAIEKTILLAKRYNEELSADERLAIICIGDDAIESIRNKLSNNSVTIIRSFDDTEMLSYTRRAITIGEWRYLGGLQFTHVIVFWPSGSVSKSSFSTIAELTALYIASSRASENLDIVLSGEVHKNLNDAIRDGHINTFTS